MEQPQEAADPRREELLAAIGVRHRTGLSDVPLELLERWRDALTHEGLARRFADPVAFACAQLRRRQPPPSVAELDRWCGHGSPGRWPQHIPPVEAVDLAEQALVERAVALAGGDSILACYIATGLKEGLDEGAAMAYAQAEAADLPASIWSGGRND